MRKSIRRSKRRVGFGFISENIMNMLKKAAGPVVKAVSKAAGSKIGNMMANKIFQNATPSLPASLPTPSRDELINELSELNEYTPNAPTREQIFKSVNLLSDASVRPAVLPSVLPSATNNDDYN